MARWVEFVREKNDFRKGELYDGKNGKSGFHF
jgi:hypothetical protein